jgi:hypothetical protein
VPFIYGGNIMKKSHLLGLVCACLIITSFSSQASPIAYTLNDVVFTDGGTASGTFTYDAETFTYSDISIATTSGSLFSGNTYTNLFNDYPVQFPANGWTFHAKSGPEPIAFDDHAFKLQFTNFLTNDGGTYTLDTSNDFRSYEGTWVEVTGSTTGGGMPLLRSIASGTVSGTLAAVPIPAAVWLFGSGLLGLLGISRSNKYPARKA